MHLCRALDFSFPEEHAEQKKRAAEFKRKSKAGFDCCVGCVDGMLLWIEKPHKKECVKAECGSKKFFCGRKGKFGLNLQGACDADCRFMDVSIKHPGATSDFLSFSSSPIYHKLERAAFMSPGLVLFGDQAYVNNRCMVTPFRNIKAGWKDSFNYYHSSLRITIECAFGQLVQRWGILRRAIPASCGLKKTVGLVLALCKLHNFCINCRLEKGVTPGTASLTPQALDADTEVIQQDGGIRSVEELLHGGEHFDDVSRALRVQFSRAARGNEPLPRDQLLEIVQNKDLHRQLPAEWSEHHHG